VAGSFSIKRILRGNIYLLVKVQVRAFEWPASLAWKGLGLEEARPEKEL